jgi:hypothetical protein
MGKADAVEEPKQLELALGIHCVEDFVGREIVDADDQVTAQIAKFLWQLLVGGARQRVEIGERRGLERAQFPQRNPVVWQNDTPCSALALTVATAAIVPAASVNAIMVSMIRRRKRASA